MELKDLKLAISQIASERGIPEKKIIETIEAALASAYKRDYGKKGQKIVAKFDLETGEASFWLLKKVIEKEMIFEEEKKEVPEGKIRFNPERHILIEEAKKIDPKIEADQELEIPLKAQVDYGRIAAQTAKQVILQKIREVEKEVIFEEFKRKEEEIVSGIVQRVEKESVFFDIGKVLGILPKAEQIPNEIYKIGQRFKLYVLEVEKGPRGTQVILSRAFPKFVSKLFELEVPEIAGNQVVIKSIAREAGSRTKIAVKSEAEGIDPIGSTVGQRGTRVMAVTSELGGEKIDITEYSEDPEKYIAKSLSPAKVLEVKILPKNKAVCFVPEDQLSLAIGKDGQNVRLAAKLTGWKIDVKAAEGQKETRATKEKKKEEKR